MKSGAEIDERSNPAIAHDQVPPLKASAVGSAVRWAASGGYFFTLVPLLIFAGNFFDPRKNDRPQRVMSRAVTRLAGARVDVQRAPGFNPERTCFLVSNHVNLFDPFILYGAVPQFFRGLELESHFRIPVYGTLMKRFGNVPVPDGRKPSDLKRMWRRTREALDSGVSLVVFPEGSRTLTGHVGPFQEGPFRMAQQFGAAITPISIVGSFEFNRKTSWRLASAQIVVHLHNTIETAGMKREDVAPLCERVRETVAAPVEAHIKALAAARKTNV